MRLDPPYLKCMAAPASLLPVSCDFDDYNADKEETSGMLEKYKNLLKKTKQARVGQIIYQEFYQCLETGATDTGIRTGWQSTRW